MRVVIIGNSGSGKSTLARALSQDGAVVLSLDDVAWDPGVVRRPHAQSVAAITDFVSQHEHWVIEGCYGELVRAVLPHCDELVFLNPGVDVCLAHCRSRPWEPDKYESKEAQDARLEALLEWVATYEMRDDEFGLACHREGFSGSKREQR